MFFGRVIFTHVFARQLIKKSIIIAKHNIQKTHIDIFHNKLLGDVAIILNVVLDSGVVMRVNVILELYKYKITMDSPF